MDIMKASDIICIMYKQEEKFLCKNFIKMETMDFNIYIREIF